MDGKVLAVNEQVIKSLGYSRDELCSMTVFDLDPWFSREDWETGNSILKEAGSSAIESHHRRRNGEVFPIQVIRKLMRFGEKEYRISFVEDITERKQNEDALHLARFIIDNANIGIYLIHPDGRIKEVNQKAAELLGYSKEELENLSMFDVDPRVALESWNTNWRQLNALNSRTIERQHLKKDGTVIPVEIRSNLLEHNGQQYAVAFVHDISERKQAEESLREKDKLLHDMGRLARIGGWKVDVESGKATSTEEVARIYDVELTQDVTVETGLGCYHGENRKKIEQAFNDAIVHGTPYDLKLEIVSEKGVRKWVRTTCAPVMTDGRVKELLGAFQDISDIKNAEMRLKESESRYRALVELSPLGIGVVDAEGRIVDINQAFAAMLGYERDELLGESFRNLTDPDDVPKENGLLRALANDERTSFALEKRYRHKNGDFFWVNITVGKANHIYGPGVFYFGFVEEISGRKQMEKEREKLIDDLKQALMEIKELRGYIPICSSCKKVRDDAGFWQQVEKYISDRTDAQFSHSLCPDCAKKLYPDFYKK